MSKRLAWALFWCFVLLSWPLAILFAFTGGWSPCAEAGTCFSDRVGAITIVLLLPLQAALAAFLKVKYR